jgi:hypothetical protein
MDAIRTALAAAVLSSFAAGQGWLDTARWYVPPQPGEFHYLADFNGDGFDDVVRFNGVPGSPTDWTGFQVLFNDGLGDFTTQGPLVSLPVSPDFFRPVDGSGLRRLRDVTGDGRPDVLVLDETSTFTQDVALRVYPGLGGGAFGAPIAIPLVGDFNAIALGQIDADPEFEIAMLDEINFSESTRWYDWNGASFTASAEALYVGGIGGATAAGMVALDLDGDGDDDLVFGQVGGQAPSGNLKRMDTVAGSPVVGASYPINLGSGHALFPFVVDLAGGGAQDLLVVESVLGGFEFWLVPVLHVGSDLVPGAKQHLTSEWGPVYGSFFEPCDWDQDGDPDLLAFAWPEPGTSADKALAMFRNDGSDGFGTGPVAQVDLMYAGGFTGLGATDLDHDGHLDYVGPQTAYFGRGRFENSLAPITSFFYGADPRLVRDAEGDGDLDYFFAGGGSRLNDGTGAFPGIVGFPAVPAGKQTTGCTAIGDLTGDGLVDFVQLLQNPPIDIFHPPTFAEMRLIVDDGLGHYVDGGVANLSPMSPFSRSTCLVLDFDGDGDNDVWGQTPGFWSNDGSGHFGDFVPLAVSQTEACAAGDLDGDGDTDLVGVAWPDQLAVLLRTGPLTYSVTIVHEDVSALEADSVTLADHDLDGDLDLSCATSWSDSVLLFANDGAGDFTPSATLSADAAAGIDPPLAYHAFGDVDGDGISDLLAGPRSVNFSFPNKVALFRGLSGSGYEPVRWYVGSGMGGAGDADGDGDLDLLGRSVVRSRLFDGPADGIIRQYGTGSPGAGGSVPVLGASGPLRPGSTTASLRLRRATGGVPLLLLYGLTEGAIPNSPFQDTTLYVQPPFFTLLLFAGGPLGAPGQGTLSLNLGTALPAAAGLTIFHQAAIFEPGTPKTKLVSNGLQLTYGL